MGVFTNIGADAAEQALLSFRVGRLRVLRGIPQGSVNSNFSVETEAGRFFLRVYEEQGFEGAAAEAELLAHLAAKGVPVAPPLEREDGTRIFALEGKPAAIFAWRNGEMRCQKSVTAKDTFAVGVALANVHLATSGAPCGEGRFGAEALLARIERIRNAQDPALAAEAEPLEEQLRRWLGARNPSLPEGLIHGDLFRDNVLWGEGNQISALLDFESASRGRFAYDLMVSILSWCFADEWEAELARAMVSGYERVRPLTDAEKDALVSEGCLACLRFTITRITDYAMRDGAIGPRVVKEYRRFVRRREGLEALGASGVRALLGLP